jgi:glycosyltransferase involved in cell wall biosynthesis
MRLGVMGIVRNEAPVIGRMLASIVPFASAVVIGDTGSTDRTCDIIEAKLNMGITPYILRKDPWRDFAHNRNLVLNEAVYSGLADYWLSVDADEVVELREPLPETETADLVAVPVSVFPTGLWGMRCCRSSHDAYWKWPIHESLEFDGDPTTTAWGSAFVRHGEGGHREVTNTRLSQNESMMRKYLRAHPGDTRMTFYLAMTLEGKQQWRQAAKLYEQRAKAGDEGEEGWYAHYRWGACLLHAGDLRGIDILLRATERRPWRAEPFATLATFYFADGQEQLGLFFADMAERIPYPTKDVLFIEVPLYDKTRRAELEEKELV